MNIYFMTHEEYKKWRAQMTMIYTEKDTAYLAEKAVAEAMAKAAEAGAKELSKEEQDRIWRLVIDACA